MNLIYQKTRLELLSMPLKFILGNFENLVNVKKKLKPENIRYPSKHGIFLPVDSIFIMSKNKFHERAQLFKTRFLIYHDNI